MFGTLHGMTQAPYKHIPWCQVYPITSGMLEQRQDVPFQIGTGFTCSIHDASTVLADIQIQKFVNQGCTLHRLKR